ncbi:MAG TPA: efflux RND transporter periplasmic adaptor subunit [Gemmatirosa sp.]
MTDASPPAGRGPLPRRAPRGLIVGSVALVGVAAASVALIAARRNTSVHHEADARTAAAAQGVVVRAAAVTTSPAARHLTLIGEARPYAEVTLYAKVSEYLQSIRGDRGDRVRAGQVLATVQSPETDRALAGAQAEYNQKHVTSQRMSQLLAQQFVSTQEADQARADAEVARQRMNALAEERGYETLRAPFDGVVTARFADPGALMQNAASSQTAALPVVTVSQLDRLRVFVYLDQVDAAAVRTGALATITDNARPGVQVPARVTRVSGTLDPRTRKMLAELDLDDRGGQIVPGGFVQVTLDLPATPRAEAPVDALITRGTASFVALVDGAAGTTARLHLVPVTVAGNDGRVVTFASGVSVGQRVALNAAALADGARVQLAPESTTVTTAVGSTVAAQRAPR